MKRAVIMVFAVCLLGGLSLVQCSKPRNAANEGTATSESNADTTAGDTTIYAEKGSKLVAYYFHGTFRCPTCLSIEKLSKETVETEFADLVKEGKVVFLSLNYDESKNAHFGDDYKLTAPSLVLSLRNNGKEVTWKNLPEVWDLAHNPPALREYVAGELQQMLMETQ
ncbi:MAG: nitrophenyl compound nitroreductase subunit ArsF family protein [Candidatus Krumholzibacteria bacterium]|nr:nitrophenyl compound nitroreductase subunit ArsF family protein [Candidatus Krumholzibacteria bacterium]